MSQRVTTTYPVCGDTFAKHYGLGPHEWHREGADLVYPDRLPPPSRVLIREEHEAKPPPGPTKLDRLARRLLLSEPRATLDALLGSPGALRELATKHGYPVPKETP